MSLCIYLFILHLFLSIYSRSLFVLRPRRSKRSWWSLLFVVLFFGNPKIKYMKTSDIYKNKLLCLTPRAGTLCRMITATLRSYFRTRKPYMLTHVLIYYFCCGLYPHDITLEKKSLSLIMIFTFVTLLFSPLATHMGPYGPILTRMDP